MQRKTVAVIVLVVLGLIVVCTAACAMISVLSYGGLRAFDRAHVEEVTSTELSVDAPASLRVHNPVGDVTVRAWDRTDRVEVKAAKEARSLLRPWAEGLLNQIEVQVRPEGSLVRVDVTLAGDSGTRFGRVDLLISVPEQVDVQVVNETGQGRIASTSGDVRVQGETGNVHLENVTVGACEVMMGRWMRGGVNQEPGGREVVLRTETGNVVVGPRQ
jgi:hypothetical protein